MTELPTRFALRRPVPQRSILRRSIAAVLLLEFLAALLLIAVAALHERHARFRSFDVMLQGRASALLGAVQDADDTADSVLLDTTGLDVPKGDIFQVAEQNGRVLGRSAHWPAASAAPGDQLSSGFTHGFSRVRIEGRQYRLLTLRGIRIVDPGEAGGGKLHRIVISYGSPTRQVEEEVLEAVRFYALTFALVMLITAAFLAWFLRRALSPLHQLASAAGRLSAQTWQFAAPVSAWQTRELAPLTAAIEASMQRLQQSFEQQRRFTGDAAHELKTDVAIIKSSLQLLTMRLRSTEEYQRGLRVSLRDCHRLEQAVAEMLTLARVENAGASGIAADTRPSDLLWHAKKAVDYLAAMAELHGVHLQAAGGDASPVFVPVSAKDCDLLCTNLLQNAVQHSKPGGIVTLDLAASQNMWTMTVQDQGEGIDARVLPHIFEPFYRADDARDRKRGGTGLGLAICKAICEKAGGTISVASQPGHGTLATVRLPSRSQDDTRDGAEPTLAAAEIDVSAL